ncbi:MAG: hypothetical protein FGF50_01410 [Candidatus Brockarchaeota archaeon]|nr:hypothetical protein [Candidatus Brockarchaeota archaeon]
MNGLNFLNGPLSNLPRIVHAKTRRVSSFDKTGGNKDYWIIGSREKVNIAEIKGAGIIRHSVDMSLDCEHRSQAAGFTRPSGFSHAGGRQDC